MNKAYISIALAAGLIFFVPETKAIDSTDLVKEQHELEQQGKRFEEQLRFDEAIDKYAKSLEIEKKIFGEKRGLRPLGLIAIALQKSGKYHEALEKIKLVRHDNKEHDYYIDREKELRAIIESIEKRNKSEVYNHIAFLREKYRRYLPPNGHELMPVTTILRTYDFIGDHDAGIRFIDEILAFFRTGKAGDPKPGRVDAEYMKVREAFEKDKAEDFKGCLQAKEGEVCMGRATKALIDSDYFPW